MTTSEQANFCVECGSHNVFEEVSPQTHVVKGRSVQIAKDRHMRCRECNAVTYPGEMLGAFLKSIADQIRREDGLLTASELMAIRLRYGFTQSEMERLIGAGEKTWVRWERGKVQQSKLFDEVIRRIDKEPAYVAELMDARGVENETARLVVEMALKRAKQRLRDSIRVEAKQIGVSDEALTRIVDVAYDSLRSATEAAFASRDDEDVGVVIERYTAMIPVDVEAIALNLGLKVYRDPNLGKDISGKIVRDRDFGGASGFAVWINQRDTVRRQRFTIAHEIAHFCLHRNRIGDGVVENAMNRSANFREPEEREADQLAARILMPEQLVREAARTTRDVVQLAKRFDVSKKAMSIRLDELKIT